MLARIMYIAGAIRGLMSNRWLLNWRMDYGGAADALTAGFHLSNVKFDPQTLQSAILPLCQGVQTAEKIASAIQDITAHGVARIRDWSPWQKPDSRSIGFRLLRCGPGKWVLLLQHGPQGALVLDPAVGIVHYPLEELLRFDQITSVILVVGAVHSAGGDKPRSAFLFGQSWSSAAEVIVGFCVRLLQTMLLLLICIILFFLQEEATNYSIEALLGLTFSAGVILLASRWMSYRILNENLEEKKTRTFLNTLKAIASGKDLLGFRGRPEHKIVQQTYENYNQVDFMHSGFGVILGAILAAIMIGFFLSPLIPFLMIVIIGLLLSGYIADRIYIALPCSRGFEFHRQHRRLSQIHRLLQLTYLEQTLISLFKFSAIVLAGVNFFDGALSDISLTYWVLAAITLLPNDVRAANALAKGLTLAEPLERLTTQKWVKPRLISIPPKPLRIFKEGEMIHVDGINSQMMMLSQSDLTAIEQRYIVCQVIERAFSSLNHAGYLQAKKPVVLGLSPHVKDTEFDMMILHETLTSSSPDSREPKPMMSPLSQDQQMVQRTEETKNGLGQFLPVMGLASCKPEEFPVMLDIVGEISVDMLRQAAQSANIKEIAILNMKRISVYLPQ